jgi:hypothetical protein
MTCLYTGRGYRQQDVADTALADPMALIAERGGGIVESYPKDVVNRKVSGSFLHNATLATFERHGFARERRIGKHRSVARATVDA